METFFSLFEATVRLACPLLLAALAGLFSERAGIVDIGLEGKMLGAAFASAAAAYVSHSPWVGLAAGIAVSVALAMLHGFVCITASGNQLISGMSINIATAGLTPVLALAWFQQGGDTPSLDEASRFNGIHLPLQDSLQHVPLLGGVYRHMLSGYPVLVYLTVLLVPLVSWLVYRSRFGLRLRAVGENPPAADAAGVSVARVRYIALFWGGVLCGIAGTYLAVYQTASFSHDMTAGKGFIAIAALIFGKWRPWPVMLGCILFAFTDAVQIRMEGVALPLIGTIPSQFIQVIPYVLTVLMLAGFVGRAQAPKAIGIPFVKSR